MRNGHLTAVELTFTASVPPGRRRKDWLAHLEICGLCELALATIEGRESTATFTLDEPLPNRQDKGEGCPNCDGTGKAWHMQGGPHGIGRMGKCWICGGSGGTS